MRERGDATAGGTGSTLSRTLDALVERYTQGPYEAEVVRARDEFGARAGRVLDDDELYEERTAAFLEWYVVERPLSAHGEVAALHALRREHDPDRAAALRAWATSHRSLFAIEAIEAGQLDVLDLVGGGRFRVDERRRLHGVAPGDVIEARLLGWRGRVVFGRTFLFHPAAARSAIEAHIARIRAQGGSRADAVDFVAALRVKAQRYKHVAPERVYELES